MKKLLLIPALLVLLFTGVKAQEVDSLQLESLSQFDSLLNTWYVKTSIDTSILYQNQRDLDHDLDVSDTVIIERLSKIPTPIQLSYTPEVDSWIRLYLKRGRSLIPTYLGLSQYYFPMFEKYLDQKNMPDELKYLPLIESALNPRARSHAGATGLWQFILGTGKRYNLEINSFVDDRMDPEKATVSAVNYLSDLYSIFNDWVLAIAAYNCGAGNVNKAIARSGGKTNFWEIYNYLPRETRGYVPAFIAMTYIMTYAQDHNFYAVDITLPYDTDTIMVSDTLHLIQVSSVLNIPIDQLRDLNPQYKLDIIPGYFKPYALRLPVDKITAFILNQDNIYNYRDSDLFANKMIVNNTKVSSTYTGKSYHSYYDPCSNIENSNLSKVYYTVKSGDNLSMIADWFDISLTELKCWNNLRSSRINVGQRLVVYKPASKVTYYGSIDKMPTAEKERIGNLRTKAQTSTNTTSDGQFVYYTVKQGESLYTIAQKFDGITHLDLMTVNNFSKSDAKNLKPGQVIKIKRK